MVPLTDAEMKKMLEDEKRREAIGAANARRAAEAFDQSRMFAAYRALFDCRKSTLALNPQHLGS